MSGTPTVAGPFRVALYCARYDGGVFSVPALGLEYLASTLRSGAAGDDVEVRVVDDLADALQWRPRVVGVGSVSMVLDDARRFAGDCKEALGCTTILGGYHVTCHPEGLPPEFDLGVLGEGEETLAEVVRALRRGGADRDTWAATPGLCYRDGDTIRRSAPRPRIADLDALPWPRPARLPSRSAAVFSSRGCPYRCAFCASHRHWGDAVRYRSAASVVDEIAWCVERYRPAKVEILDDLWIARRSRLRAIVDGIVARGLHRGVVYTGFCRSNLVDEEVVRLLIRMNYESLRFGAETGSERLLRRLKGPGIRLRDHQRAIDLCARHGLPCRASFVFGAPGETRADLEQTVAFLRRNRGKLSIAGFYLFNPLPGTALWDELATAGRVDLDLPWERLRQDYLRPGFTWDGFLYFNEDRVPLPEFRRVLQRIRAEFVEVPWTVALRRAHLRGLARRARTRLQRRVRMVS